MISPPAYARCDRRRSGDPEHEVDHDGRDDGAEDHRPHGTNTRTRGSWARASPSRHRSFEPGRMRGDGRRPEGGDVDLDEVKAETVRLSNWAHIATVGADGNPDVVPVWPAWKDDTLWIFSHTNSVKARNIAANPNVALHWQVDESGDGVEVWGTATVDTDLETKRRLWTGVFTYNLDDFAPEGLESPDKCFIAVRPERALALKQYGMAGRDTWQRT